MFAMKPEPPSSEPRFDPTQLAHLLDEIDLRDYYERTLLLEQFLLVPWPTLCALSQ
jgi:hypothetical protein